MSENRWVLSAKEVHVLHRGCCLGFFFFFRQQSIHIQQTELLLLQQVHQR